MYFIKSKRESLAEMINNHHEPYTSFDKALVDMKQTIEDEEFQEHEVEIVRLSMETVFPKKDDELSKQNS